MAWSKTFVGVGGAFIFGIAAVLLGYAQPLFTWVSDLQGTIVESPPWVLDFDQGIMYIGHRSASGIEHFQNIFYGEDTSGQNRFAPPVPIKHSRGTVVNATLPGAWCPQAKGDVFPFTSQVTNISENCLSLRVTRPAGIRADTMLPVMVWLHGGGHALGSAYEVLYEPEGLIAQAESDGQPVVFVAINYRLGVFGFAASEALVKSKATNVGLRDQRAALEWVRDNIVYFGGDPQRVTAIGHSVGAMDIGLQLTAFGGKEKAPFQKTIMMSGALGTNFNTKSDLVANNTAAIAREAGCVKNGNSQSEETLQCLRDVPFDLLTNLSVAASRAARPPFGESFFFPTHDGDFLPDRPSELVRAGKVTKGISTIAAWVSNDGAWYPPPTTSTDADVLASFGLWLTGLSGDTQEKLLELYPLADFEHMVRPDYDGAVSPQYYRAAQMNRDLWFTCPVLDFAWQYTKNGGADVRLYEHNSTRYTPAFEKMGRPMYRVSHLSDVPYVLNVQQLGGGADNSEAQLELARSISRDVIAFVTSNTFEEPWPTAFKGVSRGDMEADFPGRLSLQVFGGPYGNTVVTVDKDGDGDDVSQAEEAVRREKLFQRCELINSAKVRAETGV